MVSRLLVRSGWFLFAAGWVPFAGIFIGLIGFPVGSCAWEELPTLTRCSIIATGIRFGFTRAALFGGQIVGSWADRRARDSRQRAEAAALETWDTGTTIQQSPGVGIRLEVHPPAAAPFAAEIECVDSRLSAQGMAGVRVIVRYTPVSREVALLEA